MSNLRVARRRELLLAAGERVIARVGVEGATTRAVVTEAGMPLASFHYAFSSREEFLRVLIDQHVVPHQRTVPGAAVPGAADPGVGTFAEDLTALLTTLAEEDAADRAVTASLAFHALRHDALRAAVAERAAAFDDGLACELADLAAAHGREWLVAPVQVAAQLNCWRFGSTVRDAFSHPPVPETAEEHAPADVSTCVTMLVGLSRRLDRPVPA